MSKSQSIPQLSIVVPVGSDDQLFEQTLLSVLENQPAASEVLVSHDGQYSDPFALSDVVRFVACTTKDLVGMIGEGAAQARGRFVNVLTPGMVATPGWADNALLSFEHHDTAAVTPVIRDANTNKIAAAGWSEEDHNLLAPIACGQPRVDGHDLRSVVGCYLQASFWRREILRGAINAFEPKSIEEASYGYGRMINAAGWRTIVAEDSVVKSTISLDSERSFKRGQRLGAIRGVINPGSSCPSLLNCLKSIFSPASMLEKIGHRQSKAVAARLARRIDIEAIPTCESVLKIPTKSFRSANRRAA